MSTAAQARAWRASNPVRAAYHSRVSVLKGHGLTLEQYEIIAEVQDYRCACCHTTDPGTRGGHWQVDHDHACCPGQRSCGRCVRGLLCQHCNAYVLPVVEGEFVWNAMLYLQRHHLITGATK